MKIVKCGGMRILSRLDGNIFLDDPRPQNSYISHGIENVEYGTIVSTLLPPRPYPIDDVTLQGATTRKLLILHNIGSKSIRLAHWAIA